MKPCPLLLTKHRLQLAVATVRHITRCTIVEWREYCMRNTNEENQNTDREKNSWQKNPNPHTSFISYLMNHRLRHMAFYNLTTGIMTKDKSWKNFNNLFFLARGSCDISALFFCVYIKISRKIYLKSAIGGHINLKKINGTMNRCTNQN